MSARSLLPSWPGAAFVAQGGKATVDLTAQQTLKSFCEEHLESLATRALDTCREIGVEDLEDLLAVHEANLLIDKFPVRIGRLLSAAIASRARKRYGPLTVENVEAV